MAAKKRTTHRSRSNSKLYAERSRKGEFEDIQTYKRAHGQDVKRVSKAETAAKRKAAAKKKSAAKKKGPAKKKTRAVRKAAAPRKSAKKK
ncbi:MAG TPA: hypothetical protein VHP37_13595 [Burkholderiales bacterium]|nr:hypothetical protein [Burkholderiales bacterium]